MEQLSADDSDDQVIVSHPTPFPSNDAMAEEDDIFTALGIPEPAASRPKPNRPPRPPPPGPARRNTVPASMGSSQLVPAPQVNSSKAYIPPSLQPHEIRWFYLETGKFWQPFSGYDSLFLEDRFLELKERGQCHEAPIEVEVEEKPIQVSVMGDLYLVDVKKRLMEPIYWPAKQKWKVLRGCWFEVVGEKWYPFMETDHAIIEEEHVKEKWRERVKKDLELQTWAASSQSSCSSSSSTTSTSSTYSSSVASHTHSVSSIPVESGEEFIANKLSMEKYDIIWTSNGDVYKQKKELSSQLWNKMGQKLGKGSLFGGTKVVRGYKECASLEDHLPPIGHVVFVTHGIGQNMDASSIQQSTKEFRECSAKVAKTSFAESWNEKRVEFIPVEWRSGLSLDKGLVNTITPNSLKMLRGLVNDCVLDVFYYFSPKFGPEILNGLKTALQKQYNEFMRRNPDFLSRGGTVSVIAHSLGSVMLYDILREKCDLDPRVKAFQERNSSSSLSSASGHRVNMKWDKAEEVVEEAKEETESNFDCVDGDVSLASNSTEAMRNELEDLRKRVLYLEHQLFLNKAPEPLSFSIDHFFAFGSPTALFIAMKEYDTMVNKVHRSAESFLPPCVCKRIHNVQHPSDPIAYRLEPLVNPCYAQVKPVKMCSAKAKISQDMVDLAEGPRTAKEMEQPVSGKSWFSSQLQNMGTSLLNLASKKASITSTDSDSERSTVSEKMVDSDKQLQSEEKLRERLDFTLKESVMENSYLNSLTAHSSYWTSADCAQYVLLQVYRYKSCPGEI